MKYYVYVYHDKSGQAYYVGKGSDKYRAYQRKKHIVSVPEDSEFIQKFYFEFEWQAWECEIELIAFWQRKLDGGCLENLCTGGPGKPGYGVASNGFSGRKHSAESRKKMSESCKGKPKSKEHKEKLRQASIAYQKRLKSKSSET